MTWISCVDDRTGYSVVLNIDHVVAMWIEECDPARTPMGKDRVRPKVMLKLQTAATVYTYASPTTWTEERQAQSVLATLTSVDKVPIVRLRPSR